MGYLEEVKKELEKDSLPGGLWNYSKENVLENNWILASPFDVWGKLYKDIPMPERGNDPDFGLQEAPSAPALMSTIKKPGDKPRHLAAGHSAKLYETIYQMIVSGRKLVDISTLYECNGEFLAAIQNALCYLSYLEKKKRPVVRFLYGNYNPVSLVPIINHLTKLYPEDVLKKITARIPSENSLEVYVGNLQSTYNSWNHSKIVAVDGKTVMTGGHNLNTNAYLGEKPVFDLSMCAEGKSALFAHDYLQYIWEYVGKDYAGKGDSLSKQPLSRHRYETIRIQMEEEERPDPNKNLPMLTAGRRCSTYFLLKQYYTRPWVEPADQAFLTLFRQAKTSIRLSQQAMGVFSKILMGYSKAVMEGLAEALLRLVEVQIIVSAKDASSQAFSGYCGNKPEEIEKKIFDILVFKKKLCAEDASKLISTFFHVANLQYNSVEEGYPGDKKKGFPNHAKLVMIDDQVFYIGSQNQYYSNLNEFGIFVESREKAGELLHTYWEPMWKYSRTETAADPDRFIEDQSLRKGEAILFWFELQCNTFLREAFSEAQLYLQSYPEEREEAVKNLDSIIENAGYETGYQEVSDLLENPLFSSLCPEENDKAKAEKVLSDLMKQPGLFQDFIKNLRQAMLPGLLPEQTLDKMGQWLKQHGYSCAIEAVIYVIQNLDISNIILWEGKYMLSIGREITKEKNQREELSVKALTSGKRKQDPVYLEKETTLTIFRNGSCMIGEEKLDHTWFQKGVLHWEHGELKFGRCLIGWSQEGQGEVQCEGWISIKEKGDLVAWQAVGVRLGDVPESPEDPAGTTTPKAVTCGTILGGVAFSLLTTLAAVLFYKVSRNSERARQRGYALVETQRVMEHLLDPGLEDLGRGWENISVRCKEGAERDVRRHLEIDRVVRDAGFEETASKWKNELQTAKEELEKQIKKEGLSRFVQDSGTVSPDVAREKLMDYLIRQGRMHFQITSSNIGSRNVNTWRDALVMENVARPLFEMLTQEKTEGESYLDIVMKEDGLARQKAELESRIGQIQVLEAKIFDRMKELNKEIKTREQRLDKMTGKEQRDGKVRLEKEIRDLKNEYNYELDLRRKRRNRLREEKEQINREQERINREQEQRREEGRRRLETLRLRR